MSSMIWTFELKRETNVQLVKRLMEFSPTGAMSQMFIIEAIRRYAQEVIKAEPWPDDYVIDFGAWQRTAVFINEELEKRNGTRT